MSFVLNQLSWLIIAVSFFAFTVSVLYALHHGIFLNRSLMFRFLLAVTFSCGSFVRADLPTNADEVLAAKLTPLHSGQLSEVKSRFTDIFSYMELAERNSAVGGDELLRRALRMREDLGPMKRDAMASSIITAWNFARSSGAFNDKSQFTAKITRGTDVGQTLLVEPIVPASMGPQFTKELANYRLVTPTLARAENSPVSHRDTKYLQTLNAIAREATGRNTDQLHKDAWDAQVKQAGEKIKLPPRIRLSNRFKASPSGNNGEKWQVEVTISNASEIPAEVTMECYLLGKLWKSDKICALRKHTFDVRLKGSESRKFIAESPSKAQCKNLADNYEQLNKDDRKKSRASYTGTVILVKHGTGPVAESSTHPALLNHITTDKQMTADIVILSE